MQPEGPIARARRRARLLATLGLLLLLVSAAPAAASHLDPSRGDTVTTAAGQVAVVIRMAPERVLASHRLAPHGAAATDGAVTAALLLAFLLVLRTRAQPVIGAPRRALPTAAGRGPPLPS